MDGDIDWQSVRRVLVVRLRSIGDTVLTTPSLIALKRFVPSAQVDILLEDWVAPVLDGFDSVDNVIRVGKGNAERLKIARNLRRSRYDVAFNLHGGTTGTFFTAASRAVHRIGLANYQYPFLYNHLLSSPADFWQSYAIHSAEQQLALLGFVGVPVQDRPKTRLIVTKTAAEKVKITLLSGGNDDRDFALLHPAAAFATKQWSAENFARAAEFLNEIGIRTIAIAAHDESGLLDDLKRHSNVPIRTFDNLTLPEITALASRAKLFVGNDSGIAHIAAAVGTPSVVIFGSSSRTHWRPWTDAPNEIVFEEFACQPCAGYECKEFGEPRCVLNVAPGSVFRAINNVLEKK